MTNGKELPLPPFVAVTEQLLEEPEPERVQGLGLKPVIDNTLLLLKLTVPVGVIGIAEVSVTVTVQVVWDAAMGTGLGLQVTEVDVECLATVSVKVPKLPKWTELPP